MINLIQGMLELEPRQRLSSLKLALITHQQCLNKFFYNAQYQEHYPPVWQKDQMMYPFIPYYYQGGTTDRNKRQGEGRLFRFDGSDEVVYDGNWNNDLPEGFGRYRIFGAYCYEGQFKSGSLIHQGVIKLHDKVVYRGDWQGYMLLDQNWLRNIQFNQQLDVDGLYVIRLLNTKEVGRELLNKLDHDTIIQ